MTTGAPPGPAATVTDLLDLRLTMLVNAARSLGRSGWLKLTVLALMTLGFLFGEGMLALVLIRAIRSKEDLSAMFVLAMLHRLLALTFLVCLSMLTFSNVTAAIATIYLSRDLDLLLATPIAASQVFALKVIETILNSSYMVLLFVTPILIAWGIGFDAGPLFYAQIPTTLLLFVVPPATVAILITMVLMRYLPARRTHQMLSAVGLMLAVSLITLLRVMAPERLLAPSTSEDFAAVLRALTVPGSRYLPSTWAADLQLAAVQGNLGAVGRNLGALFALALVSLAVTYLGARLLYFRGVAAAHESGRRRRAAVGVEPRPLTTIGKELRLFFRDPTQWTQLLLLGALIIIYVFNITALPTEMMLLGAFVTLRDLVAWLNVGLAGFVLAAIAMRFVLPSISIEGGALWILLSSPASRRGYVWRKLAFYAPPMVAFALTLVALSGRALHADSFTRDLSLATTALVTFTLTAMAVGVGASLPAFKLENPAQYVLTAGGIFYGVLALLYVTAITALEARPFFWHLAVEGGVLLDGSTDPRPYYAAIIGLSALLAAASLAIGLRRLDRVEL